VLPAAIVGVRWPAPGGALPTSAPPAGSLAGPSCGGGTVGVLQPSGASPLLLVVWQRGRDLAATDTMTALLSVATAALARLDAHEALRESEQRLADAQAIAHMGSYDWDIATDRNTWSDELYRIYGFEPGAFNASYERFLSLVHPDDRETVIATHQQAYATGSTYSMRERIVRPDGEVRTLLTSGEVVLGEDGRPARMRGICWDVTNRPDIPLAAPTLLATVTVPAPRTDTTDVSAADQL
jgi:PAS domain-containing protein